MNRTIKTIRTYWYNKKYYKIVEYGNLFKLYINSVYRIETKSFEDFDKILPFKVIEMSTSFIDEYEMLK